MRTFIALPVRRIAAAALLAGVAALSTTAALAQGSDHDRDMTISAARRRAVIDSALGALREGYFDPAVASRMADAIQARVRRGEYDRITSAATLADSLTAHLRAVSHDRHVGVDYSADPLPAMGGGPRSAEVVAMMRAHAARRNHGITKVDRLDGNVGYLELDGFYDPADGGNAMAAAMTLLSNTQALIIDLRRNYGGRPGMVALLASYFFDEPVHLNDIWSREGNTTQQWWTLGYVPGARYLRKPVYVLTSHETVSAAEELANDLKVLKRATVIGETTAGGANPGGMVRLDDHFGVFVPRGRAINPVTKSNWEGTGVAPDVAVPADSALEVARVHALRAILAAKPDAGQAREAEQALAALAPTAPAGR